MTVDLSKFASLDQLVAHLDDIDVPVSGGFVIDLINFDGPKSLASTWDLDSPSVRDVPQALREVLLCERFHLPNMVRLVYIVFLGCLCAILIPLETARRVVRAFSERLGTIDRTAALFSRALLSFRTIFCYVQTSARKLLVPRLACVRSPDSKGVQRVFQDLCCERSYSASSASS